MDKHPEDKPKICPVCKVEFTREGKKLSRFQWMGRIYCSRECMKKDPEQRRWGYFG